MRSLVRGIVALFAAFCMMDVANAAPTIVSPADYSSVSTMTETFKGYLDDPKFTSSYFNYEDYGEPNSVREAQREEFFKNSAPVTVSWSGAASGTSTVKIWRTHKDTSSTPVFTKTTTESSVSFFDLEIGRNYTWTVTDSAGETATGHFYTLRHAPRMIKSYNTDTEGSACSNGRDIGGRLTEDATKAVKQGLIYRTAQLEYCNPRNADGIYGEMTWLKNVLGIKLDIDLRDASHLTTFYVGPITEGNSWTEKELTDDGLPMTLLGKHHFNYVWKNNSHLESVNESSIGEGVVRCCVPAKTGHGFPSWGDFFSSDTSKQSVWYAFNAMYESVKKGEPLVFHCSHGKDRGGTLAYVIHGVLGIAKSEATKDFLISWFDNPDETVLVSSINDNIVNKLKNYNSSGTLKQQCEAYLKECGVKSGLTSQQAADKIAEFQSLMLEEIETADIMDIGTAIEGSWGYRRVIGNEVAIVFTNENATAMTWTVPETLNNVKFLVVGGGGGAGGAASYNTFSGQYNRGGAGGGGGGVVTGLVDFVSGSIVSVKVGKGGEGGVRVNDTANGTAAAISAGAKSSFSIGETSYVIARGGGRDLGLGKSGGYGGSNAGSRTTSRQEKFSWEDTDVNTTYITAYEKLGNYGGKAFKTGKEVRAGAGGGGATEEGSSCTDQDNAAKGGKGLTSDITGVSAVYGSGGGGGSGYNGVGASGGSVEAGAGGNSSSSTSPNDGGDGLANYGGGGGGAGRGGKGGNGGSGIVVFRYTTAPTTEPEEPVLTAVDAPVAQIGLVYTGSELTGVVASTGYTLTDNAATDAGNYTAIATLAEGYKWADGSTDNKEISWSIAKATNEWTTEPSISLTEWTVGEAAGVLTAGVAKFGTVTSSMPELPTEVGSYTITYTVEENNNYYGLTKTIAFEIKAAVVVEPDPEEPGTGGEDPSEKPKLTIDDKFGYVRTGLGELGDQAIVVFTNSTEAATWKAPRNLNNVEFLAVGGGGGGGGAVEGGSKGTRQGGAGGGGGGVVIGFIKDLSANATVSVTVGNGGPGGAGSTSATTGAGAPTSNSSSSIITIDNVMYITAPGGGSGGGYDKAAIATGGSNSGGTKSSEDTALASFTYIGADAADNISNAQLLRNKGGLSYTSSSGYSSAGGGGGASEVGISAGASSYGGRGGFGYVSYITEERVVYGAGGGGGVGKSGGYGSYIEDDELQFVEGAGLGGVGTANGSAGLANQGGGGGGGSYGKDGGAGGSGIVVLRFAYSENDIPVDASVDILPLISDKVYTGEVLSSGLVETYAYTVEELKDCVNVGAKVVRATLNEGYVWADGTIERYKDFAWNILKQDNNVWTTTPFINVDSWGQTYTGNVIFNQAVPLLGDLISTIAKDGGEAQPFNGVLPSEPGTYKLIYKVEGTDNFSSLYWEKSFKIYESETFAGGYKVYGLGKNGNEVAVVFTSSANWTVPQNIKSARFLVVGGGGGGGADVYADAASGGAGGGGGGVVTGEVDLTKDATVIITVGDGGAGGELAVDANGDASGYGGSMKGGDSSFVVEGVNYVTAFGGGNDQGTTVKDSNSADDWDASKANVGGTGGSNAGSRGGYTTLQSSAPTMGSVAEIEALRNCVKYGNIGGKGCSQEHYGFPAAGGGGGADPILGLGGDAGNQDAGFPGGKGGEGLTSDITGAQLVYGSGGGGASHQGSLGGKGGTGAGDGGDDSGRTNGGQGTSALANQGGGGGGSSRETTYGGNGGSGIVVFRYVVNTTPTVGGVEVKVDANGVITNITTACDNFVVVGDLSNYKFADYYTAIVADDGKLRIALNPEVATPVINETANGANDAIVVTDAKVVLGVTNAKVGLYYSVEAHSDPTCIGTPIHVTKPILATGEIFSIEITKPNVDAAFFRVVVTDIPSIE